MSGLPLTSKEELGVRVFISWSGPVSQRIAQELAGWLPSMIQSIEPFISKDIESGARWSPEIARELAETDYGIICVTPENPAAPWLNFEAGALGKSIVRGRVVPYLCGLGIADLPAGPLTQFQAKLADKDGTRRLVEDLNAVTERPLSESQLDRAFDLWWPGLSERLDELAAEAVDAPQQQEHRSQEDMLREVLELVRAIAQSPAPGGGVYATRVRNWLAHWSSTQLVPDDTMTRTVRTWKELRHELANTADVPENVTTTAGALLDAVREIVDAVRQSSTEVVPVSVLLNSGRGSDAAVWSRAWGRQLNLDLGREAHYWDDAKGADSEPE
jgi:hypothetical protein